MLALLFLLHLGRPDMHIWHDGHEGYDVRRGGGGLSVFIVLPRQKGAYERSYFFTNT